MSQTAVNEPSEWLGIGDVAKRMDRSTSLVGILERTGQLPAIRTAGGVRIFRRQDVEEFIKNRETKRKAG